MNASPSYSRIRWTSRRLGDRSFWILASLAAPLSGLLFLPLAALLLKAPPALVARYFGNSTTIQAITLSLVTSSATVLLAIGMGTPLAYLLGRRRFPGRHLLDVLVDLPTVLPPAVAGIALLMALGRRGLLGPWLHSLGIDIPFTPVAVVLAQTFVASPYYIKAAAIGLSGVNDELLDAAALDGASSLGIFRFVTAPLAWRSIVGGAALCWSRALGEFGATIIFAGNFPGRTQTMPLAVYIGFEIDMRQALTLAVVLLAISFALLLTIRALLNPAETH